MFLEVFALIIAFHSVVPEMEPHVNGTGLLIHFDPQLHGLFFC